MLIKPERESYEKMLSYAKSIKSVRNPYWSLSEMSFINYHFNLTRNQTKQSHESIMLSHVYTYGLYDCICENHSYKEPKSGFVNPLLFQLKTQKVYHFTPGIKPWRYSLTKEGAIKWGANSERCVRVIVDEWARHRTTLWHELSAMQRYLVQMCLDRKDEDCTVAEPPRAVDVDPRTKPPLDEDLRNQGPRIEPAKKTSPDAG